MGSTFTSALIFPFYSTLLGSKITADSDCIHEIKTLVLRNKSYDKPRQHIKSRDTTLLTKVHLVKAMVFPAVMHGCESWTIKKAERQEIDAFELWCWKRLLRVPWTANRSNQSILKEINPEYSLEGLMLKLQYFVYTSALLYRRRQWHPTPVLLPGKSHGWRNLVGCSPWGR